MVITKLIKVLSQVNYDNTESSLNAMYILIEMVEVEQTFKIFLENDAEKIGTIIELAIDPSNSFNQKYLLSILLMISKQLKPVTENMFKDLEDEDTVNEQKKNQFDPTYYGNANLLKFLD